jgi:hypothetical protein
MYELFAKVFTIAQLARMKTALEDERLWSPWACSPDALDRSGYSNSDAYSNSDVLAQVVGSYPLEQEGCLSSHLGWPVGSYGVEQEPRDGNYKRGKLPQPKPNGHLRRHYAG